MLAIKTIVVFSVLLHFCNAKKVKDEYYPRYHLAPPHGWMNDPNGFSFFQGEYHLFYQFNPKSCKDPGFAHWGHAKSRDLFTWEHLPVALYPDKSYDSEGVFSGSAIVENNTMYLFYTGNIKHPNENPDHEEFQALAYTTDGVNVVKYEGNPIINAPEHQPDIRDPKVWKHGDTYYMVLGESFNSGTLGRILLYASKNLISWEQVSILGESDGSLGFMWECPDLFELDGKFVLLFSPQGMKAEGDKYKNLFQTGYVVGDFDYNTHKFTPITKFVELDSGHDFYATQTMLGPNNRRLLVAWLDTWEPVYPERKHGWTGQMTLVRELSLDKNYRLIQKPISEIKNVRGRTIYMALRTRGSKAVELLDKTGEIQIEAKASKDLDLFIGTDNPFGSVKISYDHERGLISLDRGGDDGLRRTEWKPNGKLNMLVYVDASSIEVFCGNGEVTFSSRFFPQGKVFVRLGENTEVDKVTISQMKRTVKWPESIQKSTNVLSIPQTRTTVINPDYLHESTNVINIPQTKTTVIRRDPLQKWTNVISIPQTETTVIQPDYLQKWKNLISIPQTKTTVIKPDSWNANSWSIARS